MEFPQHSELEVLGHHFMLGPALLVVPVSEAYSRKESVFLPSGKWYDFYDWTSIEAGHHDVPVQADRIPVFVRGGNAIFRLERLRRSTELMKDDPYYVYISLDSEGNASGKLYIDDGKTYSYEQGDFLLLDSLLKISFQSQHH
jgi:alpha 1,3-glucosidase